MSGEASGDAPAAAGSDTPSRPGLLAGIAVVVLALDQITKTWAQDSLAGDRTIDLVGSLRFNLAFNTGASFSIGSGSGFGPTFSISSRRTPLISLARRWESLAMSVYPWEDCSLPPGNEAVMSCRRILWRRRRSEPS